MTVLTGDDAVIYLSASASQDARRNFQKDWTDSRVTVRYTVLGHPALPGHLLLDLYHKEFGGTGESEFQDVQAILAHDAVWTAGVAIRDAAGADGKGATNAGSELRMLARLNDGETVAGISGPISLGADGNPEGKPMALVRLEPDQRYTFESIIKS